MLLHIQAGSRTNIGIGRIIELEGVDFGVPLACPTEAGEARVGLSVTTPAQRLAFDQHLF